MNIIEIILLTLMTAYSIMSFLPAGKKPVWLKAGPTIIIVVGLIQILLDGFKWQLILVYLISLVLFTLSLKGLLFQKSNKESSGKKWMRITGMILCLVICYFSFKSLQAFPQFKFPEPTGEYGVGTKYYLFEDPGRKSIYFDHESGNYRITVQVWYPAEEPGSSPIYYQTKSSATCIASIFNLPGFVMHYLSKIRTNSYYEAKPSVNVIPYPVIFYSPGGTGWINQPSAVNEELASNGFVVISVGHESTEPFLRDKHGEVIPLNLYNQYAQAINRELYSEVVENIKGQIINCQITENKYELHKQLNKVQPVNVKDVKTRAENIYYIIGQLPVMNKDLLNIIDTLTIGIYGFSKGGAVAGEVCVNNNLVSAGINLDGFMYGDIMVKPLPCPFMFIHSVSSDPQAYINDYFFSKTEADAYLLKISGTTHANFGDLSLFGGIFKDRGILGSINGERAIELQRKYILAFFNKYLKGTDSGLLDNDSQVYNEIELYRR